jgi:hypothetical protein
LTQDEPTFAEEGQGTLDRETDGNQTGDKDATEGQTAANPRGKQARNLDLGKQNENNTSNSFEMFNSRIQIVKPAPTLNAGSEQGLRSPAQPKDLALQREASADEKIDESLQKEKNRRAKLDAPRDPAP